MPRSDGSDAWGNHKSESETKRTVDLKIGEGGEEMLVCNCKLYLTLKLCAKKCFSLFFPGSSVEVHIYTASVLLCLVFPSVL